ncbi:MAG: hypothetical protein IT303_12385 [Dehalococcoidia bacterium]|nr:hypothetical protein [Dehalococcoidia bacterium]
MLGAAVAGCGGGGSSEARGTGSPSAVPASPTGAPTAPPTATPTATPDPVGARPATAQEATERLAGLIGGTGACPELAVARWGLSCVTAQLDADARPDTAYLVPLDEPGRLGFPASVLVCRTTANCVLERLGSAGAVDASALGRGLFQAADITGDGRAELVYLSTLCTAATCTSEVAVQAWDGSAWRNLGPRDGGLDNVDAATLTGTGAAATLTVHTAKLPESSGPSRALTVTYTLEADGFVEASREAEETVFLVHAIQDADRLFALGRYDDAIAAYQAAIASPTLRDWRTETEGPPPAGRRSAREQLVGYVLLRVAIAETARGNDATRAIDAAIVQGKEPLFQNAAQAFRRGLLDRGDLRGGCIEATRYLTTDPAPAYIAQVFDYGPANPRLTAPDICPF